MPELPEVETMVRGIRPFMDGAKVLELVPCPCERRPMTTFPDEQSILTAVSGQRIAKVERLAKRILWELETGDTLAFEPRMTGLTVIADPPSMEHLRYEFRLQLGRKRHSVWIWDRRGLGTLSLYTQQQREHYLSGDRLGPDALTIAPQQLVTRFQKTSRAIKVALLDQKLVAGIGNLYASEILHLARIHPETPANRLSISKVKRLHEAIGLILNEAIIYEGSTLNDGTYRNALNKDGNYQNQHRVYAKDEEPCRTCGRSNIIRIVQAQRSTFYCPVCQGK